MIARFFTSRDQRRPAWLTLATLTQIANLLAAAVTVAGFAMRLHL